MRQMARAAALSNQGVDDASVNSTMIPIEHLPVEFVQLITRVRKLLAFLHIQNFSRAGRATSGLE